MNRHPNEALVRAFFQAFSQAEFRSAAEMFADDVVLHVPGRNPFSGTIRGRKEWLASLRKYAEAQATGVTFGFDVHDVVGGDEHTVALLSARAERDGERVEWHRVAVYHVSAAKIREVWIHDVDQESIDEFFRVRP